MDYATNNNTHDIYPLIEIFLSDEKHYKINNFILILLRTKSWTPSSRKLFNRLPIEPHNHLSCRIESI